MNGIHLNSKPRPLDKPVVPGCLGRMVNLFDLASSKSNRLLTDKPHYDVSSLSRSRSDTTSMSNFTVNEMQDEAMISEARWSSPSKNPHGTPVKMLMAQEMSKELTSKQNSPNVVARLMGLDALPRNHSRSYSQNSHTENYWQEEHDFPHQEQNEYKDIYEIRRDPSRGTNCVSENLNEQKLALIRQKFTEAKQLATDEKLRETKEFRDALDVLSSNGELFLKVLQEPNSVFSHLINGGKFVPTPVEPKRITVLKPSKNVVDEKFATPKKQVDVNSWDNRNGFSPTMSMWKDNGSPAQPIRIVVLKPSVAKLNDAKKTAISSTGYFSEDEEAREAREVAKEITERMRENLHRRDETVVSSACSNGYTGDESSLEKSEDESATGNVSDTEFMSPTSRNSWEYGYQYGSPYSSTSFSRPYYSPAESPVSKEAKRRLSERWAMMSEQRQIQQSSSTLGEMLAISDVINPEICEEDKNTDQVDSPRSLLRSKSVPVSSTAYGVSNDTKMKASKSSFAGKVASLLFSRNKKPKNENLSKPESKDHEQGTSYQQGGENQEQPNPSPISVLEPHFEEETGKSQIPVFPSRSNLIDKSPPIGSISRKLSFDEYYSAELPTSTSPLNSSPFDFQEADDNDEDEWQSLVQSLLKISGLDNDDSGPNYSKWHSPESPLDPSLREKYVDLTAKESRKLRSTRKLVFDCVNAALMDMSDVRGAVIRADKGFGLADRVWARAKEWVSGNVRCTRDEEGGGGDSASLVETEVWKEVMGKEGWDEQISLEVEIIGKEIEGKLLKELVEDSVLEWALLVFTH